MRSCVSSGSSSSATTCRPARCGGVRSGRRRRAPTHRVVRRGGGPCFVQVANYVLAAVSMLSPPLRGFTARTFPYTNLSNIDTVLQLCVGRRGPHRTHTERERDTDKDQSRRPHAHDVYSLTTTTGCCAFGPAPALSRA
jgi:hypothetical protein